MLEDEIVACPICGNEIAVKVQRASWKSIDTHYIVLKNCSNCKTSASKIERIFNNHKRNKTERSYIKVNPRG